MPTLKYDTHINWQGEEKPGDGVVKKNEATPLLKEPDEHYIRPERQASEMYSLFSRHPLNTQGIYPCTVLLWD